MAEVYSLPASTSLVNEVNQVGSAKRLTAQDGTIGDRAHMQRVSDHNLDELGNTGSHSDSDNIPEVHARDIDSRGPWLPGWSMMRIVLLIVGRCAAKLETRLLYIIFDGWIWEASNGWKKRKYSGADQHHEHAHFSFRYGSGTGPGNPENDTSPWGILAAHQATLEDDMPLTSTELDAIAERVWARRLANPYTKADQPAADFMRYAPSASWHQATQQQIAALTATVNKFVASEAADDDVKHQALQAIYDSISAVAPGVAAQVLAALPQGSDPVTQDEVTAAVETAFRRAFAPATA